MTAELMMALHEQYLSYVDEISKVTKNLMTFLDQNKDFRNGFDVSVMLYIKSADIKLSCERRECCSSPDLQIIGGDRDSLKICVAELANMIAE